MNDKEYKSFAQFKKEYNEKGELGRFGSAKYVVPAAIAGAGVGFLTAPAVVRMTNKMPDRLKRNVKNYLKPMDIKDKIMSGPQAINNINNIAKSYGLSIEDAAEIYRESAEPIANKARGIVPAAITSAALSAFVANRIKGAKGTRKAERESGYNESTNSQLAGRMAGGAAGMIAGSAATIPIGKLLDRIIPKAPQNIMYRHVNASPYINTLRSAAIYGLPAYYGSMYGDMLGQYAVSRYAQRHTRNTDNEK